MSNADLKNESDTIPIAIGIYLGPIVGSVIGWIIGWDYTYEFSTKGGPASGGNP
jgi:hypothetical protein